MGGWGAEEDEGADRADGTDVAATYILSYGLEHHENRLYGNMGLLSKKSEWVKEFGGINLKAFDHFFKTLSPERKFLEDFTFATRGDLRPNIFEVLKFRPSLPQGVECRGIHVTLKNMFIFPEPKLLEAMSIRV